MRIGSSLELACWPKQIERTQQIECNEGSNEPDERSIGPRIGRQSLQRKYNYVQVVEGSWAKKALRNYVKLIERARRQLLRFRYLKEFNLTVGSLRWFLTINRSIVRSRKSKKPRQYSDNSSDSTVLQEYSIPQFSRTLTYDPESWQYHCEIQYSVWRRVGPRRHLFQQVRVFQFGVETVPLMRTVSVSDGQRTRWIFQTRELSRCRGILVKNWHPLNSARNLNFLFNVRFSNFQFDSGRRSRWPGIEET